MYPFHLKAHEKPESDWKSSSAQNLIRYVPSGTYFARFKSGGKLIRKSLGTTVFSVAKLRLPDVIKEHRGINDSRRRFRNGRMTVGDAVQIYRDKLDANVDLKPRTKYYYRLQLNFIERSWPGLLGTDVRQIKEADYEKWLAGFRKKYSASVTNNAIGVIRAVMNEAISTGARFGNPATGLKRVRLGKKKLNLPSRDQFLRFVETIESGGSRDSKNAADLVRLLAFSGMRVGEAQFLTWGDVDWQGVKITVRGDPVTGTKGGEDRTVPMIPELTAMLRDLRAHRSQESPNTYIMKVRKCQRSMTRAAKIVKMSRITHHDLRHLFATICIESGVDVPTISRWLGHTDGGAICMKTYGHLRNEHSVAQAQRVRFGNDR